ncbi:MAG: tetratricopeptide repeat protein, partial [Planctomycetes bacterium]|nr:tetratricopeptide repeat protein [Planctomycetota bacterium]
MHKHTVALAALVLAAACAAGCRSQAPRSVEYQTLAQDPNRDTETARRENGRALALIEQGQLEEAEKALKAALAADLFFGPAHNNLAVVYQKREQYYLAAWEFQYAAKLMPYSPEPRANLGLVYEAVGRTAEAESWFDKALALQPDNPELIGN